MNEDDLLVNSIKKLQALNVSNDEILMNLKEMGVSESKARELILKSKPAQNELLKDKHPETQEMESTETEEDQESKAMSEAMEEEEGQGKVSVSSSGKSKPGNKASTGKSDMSKLWEKGILVTVTQNLEEMQKLKTDIEKVIDAKVRESAEKERKKMQVLMESQRNLLSAKVNSELEGKEKEITEIIDSKIAELSSLGSEIQENLQAMEDLKKEQERVLKEFAGKKEELVQTKTKIIVEMNSELIKSKSSAQEVLGQIKDKLAEIDTRVDKSLELESKIVEGLIADAEDQITQIKEDKRKELSGEIESELEKLENVRKKIEPEKLQERIKELSRLSKEIEEKFSAKEKDIELFKQQIEVKAVQSAKNAMEEKISESAADIKREMDVDGLKKKMGEVEDFRKQFVQSMQFNIDKLNEKLKVFNDSTTHMMEEFEVRVKKIDSKIEELDTFEKNFASEMGLAVEELIKRDKDKREK